MRLRHRYDWTTVAFTVFVIGTILLGIVVTVRECKAQAKCRDNGGYVQNYNCRMFCQSDSNGFMTCSEHCDWRCVGASAEDAR